MNMTIDEVVTELSMSYSHKMHLILEGDDDRKFLLSVINDEALVNTVCVYGSDRVIETVSKVERDLKLKKSLKVLGVIDRDYREPLNKLPHSTNILITDHRDLECMMIDSPVFTRVLRELGSAKKIKLIGGATVVKQHVLRSGKTLGELRYYSQRSDSHWTFQKLDITKFLDKKTMTLDEEKLVGHLKGHQSNDHAAISLLTVSDAKIACNEAVCSKNSKYFVHDLLICRGHDLMAIFGLALRSFCGTINAVESTVERLEGLFRVGFAPYFSRTKLCKSITAWVNANGLQQDVVLI